MKLHAVPRSIIGLALTALIFAPWVRSSFAQSPLAQSVSNRPAQLLLLNYLPALADFDGDQRLDQAEVQLAGALRCIRVRFGDSRESHLLYSALPESRGAILARDVNRDDKPDLILISQSRSQPALVWLNDGLGHFARSAGKAADEADLHALFPGNIHLGIAGSCCCARQVYLEPEPLFSELARAANLESETLKPIVIAGYDYRRDLGLYLSYLRERGPPLHTSFS